ncbi:sensor histidine kinase [Actinoallomurus soli]|uniref:sensor histidine kinase n=1 Tax=Actinoallomurus soli TaxID=2952535 RepID=UPI002091FC7A|nr:histidine kinase [Actinoallomurus soli]MCO5969844.1 histidine kinase [Actinoallomurus soli]
MTTHVRAGLRRTRGWLTGRPWLTDLALGGGLTAFDVMTLSARTPAPSVAGLALWGLQTVPLFWRRRRPGLALAAMTIAFAVFEAADPVPGKTPGPYFLIFGVFAVARRASARVSLAWTLPALAVAVTADLLTGRSGPPRLDSLEPITATTFVAYFLVAWLLGYGARRIDLDARRLRDLNERLRAQQEINARQAVVTERARIARDLHDVVAHHVSAIAVQARSTEEIVQDDPRLGRRGVARIAETADTALVEMRRILGLLAAEPESVGPEPSLRNVDRLIEAAEATGCRVTAALDAPADAVPAAIQVSAYRILQEAVTNVFRHAGPVDVRVAVRVGDRGLTIEVENAPAAAGHRPVPGSGRGLIGIRERVTAFDGTLHAGPRPHGGWRIHATLPLQGLR